MEQLSAKRGFFLLFFFSSLLQFYSTRTIPSPSAPFFFSLRFDRKHEPIPIMIHIADDKENQGELEG